ncbi:MAG: hypothetical protein V4736_08680 [Bdellovibrionota bacterium]
MKLSLVLAVSLLTSAAVANNSPAPRTIKVHGNIGSSLAEAMIKAGAKPVKCENKVCVYQITEFRNSDEGDGCGGGTSKYETNFTYSNGKKYQSVKCTGEDSDTQGDFQTSGPDKGQAIAKVLRDLDLSENEGWDDFVTADKIECEKYSRTDASCQITHTAQAE